MEHAVIRPDFPMVDADGGTVHRAYFGGCEHGHGLLYLTNPPMSDACRCRAFEPEPWPRLAALVGHDLLREVEAIVGFQRPAVGAW